MREQRRILMAMVTALVAGPAWAEDRAEASVAEKEEGAEKAPAEATGPDYEAARREAIGEEMESLKLGAKTYNKVVITSVDDVGIQIRHEAGSKRIPFLELPKAMRDRFGFSLAKAREQKGEEAERQVERARLAAERREMLDEKRTEERTAAEGERKVEDIKGEIRALHAKITKLQNGIIETDSEITRLEGQADRYEADAQYTVARSDGTGNLVFEYRTNHAKLKRAATYRERALREEAKVEEAKELINGYERELRLLNREFDRIGK